MLYKIEYGSRACLIEAASSVAAVEELLLLTGDDRKVVFCSEVELGTIVTIQNGRQLIVTQLWQHNEENPCS